ncbi:glycosyltransferase [Myceligenerans pegani]|uniref:Glycosyltransferase n=1 Tax=Myceligenerans pegani TaxID=2776917 RepID=A0ABR9MYB9_9MICO|nr:glycosyltransferase [Myceligenerans sp. TRM 65318]MBE1876376.1 glycosyltransferase [Myceligenerans sp. TRM 65318]MBE3018647.1 glycosyltransferase [Myceligenerans sp. TRM 65318]
MTDGGRAFLVFPRWVSNPYLTMLYLAAEADGWNFQGTTSLQGFEHHAEGLVAGDVAHVHWTSPVLAGCETDAEALARLERFRGALAGLRSRGAHVLWTVHNELAHDARFPDVEKQIGQALAEHATVVVQLHEHTAAAVSTSYRIPPEKLVTVRHSSYAGVYPDGWTTEQARAELGVPEDAYVVGFIGQIRPYKGVDVLCAAIEAAAQRMPDLALLLAGRVSAEDAPLLEKLLPASVPVVEHLAFVPDEELGLWLRATDIVALPYQRILNSGSALLAASFGTPVVIPGSSTLSAVYEGEDWVRTYRADGDQAANLADALVEARTATATASESAARFAREYTPWAMSRDFLAVLDALPAAAPRDTPTNQVLR